MASELDRKMVFDSIERVFGQLIYVEKHHESIYSNISVEIFKDYSGAFYAFYSSDTRKPEGCFFKLVELRSAERNRQNAV